MLRRFFKEAGNFLRDTSRAHRMAFTYVPRETLATIFSALFSAVSGFLIAGSSALLINALISVGKTGAFPEHFYLTLAFAISALVLPDFVALLRDFFDQRRWLRLSTQLDILFLRAQLGVDIATNERPSFQDTLGKANERGIYPIMNLLDNQYGMLADIATLLIASVVLVKINPLFLFLLALGTLPRLFVGIRHGRMVWSLYDMNAEDRRRFFALKHFPQSPPHLMEAHLLGLRDALVMKLRNLAEPFVSAQLSVERKKALLTLIATIFFAVSLAAVYGMSIRLIFLGGISIGGFVFLTSAIGSFAGPLQRIFLGLSQQYEFTLFARQVFTVLDTTPSVALSTHPVPLDASRPPEIIFEHVTFRYPDSDHDVLRDVSFRLAPGSSFALVGINGAGKTTLVKLLARFYDPSKGRILVNGVDLRYIDLPSWYRSLATLFQHFPNYESYTASEGIAFGDVSQKENNKAVEKAARAAGADTFIKKWKHGYEQVIGKQFTDGIEPSRGQEQRLALARMFYRNAVCLVLDEPTAAVDAESEAHIFEAIEQMEGKTRILISHRFSTVRNADQICVLDGGKVKELGTHKELMSLEGEYARLFRMQAKGYQEDDQLS